MRLGYALPAGNALKVYLTCRKKRVRGTPADFFFMEAPSGIAHGVWKPCGFLPYYLAIAPYPVFVYFSIPLGIVNDNPIPQPVRCYYVPIRQQPTLHLQQGLLGSSAWLAATASAENWGWKMG